MLDGTKHSYGIRRQLAAIAVLSTLAPLVRGQDRSDWQSLAQLRAGDRVRLSLKTRSVSGTFQSWTAAQVQTDKFTAQKADVLKVERYRPAGGRGKRAAIGALIGFGGGFAIGAAAGGCNKPSFGPCFTRSEVGAVLGGAGAVIGAAVGALIPKHRRELIYSASIPAMGTP